MEACMFTVNELSKKTLTTQKLIDEKLFQIDINLPNFEDLKMETTVDAQTFYRFQLKENKQVAKINLLPLNDAAKESSDTYDYFDEINIYNSLIKDERDEGYYYIDLFQHKGEKWSFRMRSEEIINLLSTPKSL